MVRNSLCNKVAEARGFPYRRLRTPMASDDIWERAFRGEEDSHIGFGSGSSSTTTPTMMRTTLQMASAGNHNMQANAAAGNHNMQAHAGNHNNAANPMLQIHLATNAEVLASFPHYPNLTAEEAWAVFGMLHVFG